MKNIILKSIIIFVFFSTNIFATTITDTQIEFRLDGGSLQWNGVCGEEMYCFPDGNGCSITVNLQVDDSFPVLDPGDIWTCSLQATTVNYDIASSNCTSYSPSVNNFTFPKGSSIVIIKCLTLPNVENMRIDISDVKTDNSGHFVISFPYPLSPSSH